MTCEEFVEFTGVHPLKLTRAERSAVIVHRDGCERCSAWLKEESDKWEAQRSPLQAVLDEAECLVINLVAQADKADPEVRR